MTEGMRAVLVDWLVEVHHKFRLENTGTLFLAISILDRYLELCQLKSRRFLQLVGLSALLIASKVEETRPAVVEELGWICEHTYTDVEIRDMEFHMLRTLSDSGIQLRVPLAPAFACKDSRYKKCYEKTLLTKYDTKFYQACDAYM